MDSSEVVQSVYVANSHGVYESNNIIDCHTVWFGETLTDCGFCYKCTSLSHALFCFEKTNDEFLLFNKSIDKARFEMINKQFHRYVSVVSEMTTDWEGTPRKVVNYQKHTKYIPESFWKWVQTLPGFDSELLYSLTFNPLFLK
jgi:hypothetical protein